MSRTAEMLEDLPDHLAEAARAALADGTTWEDRPDSADPFSDQYCWYCKDCVRWHSGYIMAGYRVEDRVLYMVAWTVDMDGEWEEDAHPVEAPDFDRWYQHTPLDWNTIQVEWLAYYRYVAETGNDHLAIYTPDANQTVQDLARRSLGPGCTVAVAA